MSCILTACSMLVACYHYFCVEFIEIIHPNFKYKAYNNVCVLSCLMSLYAIFSFTRRATLLSARQGMMSARGDFLNYALSLMRSHNDEHSDVLPVLDVCSLKHVAYVFQALIYWIKAMNQQTTLDTPQLERKRY